METRRMCCLQLFCLILIGLFVSEIYSSSSIVSNIIDESIGESFEENWIVSKTEDYLAKSKDIVETESKGIPKKPRFLCLHGHGSNATLLEDHFKNWPDFVLEKMDFVFINGPFPVDDGLFEWFTSDEGAVVAGVLPGMQAQGVCLTKVGKIEHVIIISGAKLGGRMFPMPKLAETAFSSPINIPSLHIFGETDIARLNALELVEAYVDPLVIFHRGGHEVPKLDEDGLKIMFTFLKEINAIV
ncbi:esterase AGAP003155 isoform X2 [Helianthus annuus]|uniref:esterase AGAP003155 isoform X2 n=1 Tax=Helianthus annuus TaxID=4232 RepID=UPI0016531ABC|nr:esterase AGAP003155 isoform X2 [Helianthus annuus]